MKKLIVFFAIVFAMVSMFAQEEKVTLKECSDLCKKAAATELEQKVSAGVANPDPKIGAKEIASAVMIYQQKLSVDTLKKANDLAAALYYKKGKVDELFAEFKKGIDDEIKKINEKITAIETKNTEQDTKITAIETKNTEQDTAIGNISIITVKNSKDIEDLKKSQQNIYGFVTLGLSTAVNIKLVNMSLGIGLGLPFKYFTVEAGAEGGLDLTSNNLTTIAHAGMIFPMKDWADKGSIHFIVKGMFYSIIKLPEDNVNTSLLGLGYYGGGGLAVRYLLPVGKAELLFQSGLNGLYGEGRERTDDGWKRILQPVVEIDLFKFGVLF
ncbi:MAG TPA: hypothetical protein P5230_00810 [Candidatus Magasanikbacteria bacterium]|nr:hypothetical protein [Candidatus Magasanikbacteria bacterium]